MNKLTITSLLVIILGLISCTPKAGETVTSKTAEQTTANTPPSPVVETGPCKSWNTSPKKSDIIEAHVLYKDQLKEVKREQKKGADQSAEIIDKLYKDAFKLWQKAYSMAPAADGKRADHFEDGIRIQDYFFRTSATPEEKQAALDKIMELYDGRDECYNEPGYADGRKAFDLFYKYPEYATDIEKYELFKKSINASGEKADYFILNPFTSLIVNLLVEDKIPIVEAQKYQSMIRASLARGLKNCKTDKECEPWKIVEGYVPVRLEQLEGVENFYDCEYYSSKYFADYLADSTNCDVINEVLSRLRWGKCDINSAELARIQKAKAANCITAPPPAGPLRLAKEALEEARYKDAISHYEEFISNTSDNLKKARFTLRVAQIYYVHLKSFSKARKYAREAAKYRPNWGQPYMLIGRLYASSGPLCGPGRGWDSQVVTWPAIDMWTKAKQLDPEVAAEANKFIRRYQQYMPSIEDIFQRGLKEGGSFKVPCWIQETTRIRAAKQINKSKKGHGIYCSVPFLHLEYI